MLSKDDVDFLHSCDTDHHPVWSSEILLSLNCSAFSLKKCMECILPSGVFKYFFPFLNICICAFFTCKWIFHWLPMQVVTFGSPEKLNTFSKGRAGPKCHPVPPANLIVLNQILESQEICE